MNNGLCMIIHEDLLSAVSPRNPKCSAIFLKIEFKVFMSSMFELFFENATLEMLTIVGSVKFRI